MDLCPCLDAMALYNTYKEKRLQICAFQSMLRGPQMAAKLPRHGNPPPSRRPHCASQPPDRPLGCKRPALQAPHTFAIRTIGVTTRPSNPWHTHTGQTYGWLRTRRRPGFHLNSKNDETGRHVAWEPRLGIFANELRRACAVASVSGCSRPNVRFLIGKTSPNNRAAAEKSFCATKLSARRCIVRNVSGWSAPCSRFCVVRAVRNIFSDSA